MGNNLPSIYQEVEYLQSSGTQYIDSSILPSLNTKIEIRGIQGSSDCALFGLSTILYAFHNTNKLYYAFFDIAGNNDIDIREQDVIIEMSKASGLKINNTTITDFSSATSGTVNYSLTLFGRRNNTDGSVSKLGNNKINYCKIWDGSTLVRNFIPCYRKSDSVAGMYDTVNSVFYTNSGTGSFVVGPDALNEVSTYKDTFVTDDFLPSAYQKVEYLQSSGTQYIDTNIIPTVNDEIILEAQLTSMESGKHLFGTASDNCVRQITTWQNSIYLQNVNTDTTTGSVNIPIDTDKHTYKIKNGDNSIDTLTGATSCTGTTTNFYRLFERTSSTITSPASMKCYSLKIYNESTLANNFVPCYRKSDNVAGMYDLAWEDNYTGGSIDLGTLTWTYFDGDYPYFRSSAISDMYNWSGSNDDTTIYNEDYTKSVVATVERNDKQIATKARQIYISDHDYTDATAFTQAMSGKTLYYQRDTDTSWHSPFYTNAGTGSFVVGEDVTPTVDILEDIFITEDLKVPADYQEVEYLYSNGSAYITIDGTNYPSGAGYLYSFEVSTHNMYPCYRKSDNVAGMYDINNSGKNLFDKTDIVNGYVKSDGTIETVSWYYASDYIDISGLSNITISNSTSSSSTIRYHCFYDEDKNFISGFNENESVRTTTVPSNAKYIRISIGTSMIDSCMLESGTTATTYEPYPFYRNSGTGSFVVGPDVTNYVTTYFEYFIV